MIVEFQLPGASKGSTTHEFDGGSDDESITEEEKVARRAHDEKVGAQSANAIVPELAELGVYAQSVKPSDITWFDPGELLRGPHHHLINVSESGLGAYLPRSGVLISRHNSQHLMRVFPKGTRIASSNLRPVAFWGIGAQICALNWQTFGLSNQLNAALFDGSEGYILKPAALRSGGSGKLSTGRKKRLRLHVAGAADIPVHEKMEADAIRPYLTCTLIHPDHVPGEHPKEKTKPYKHHQLGFMHKGKNPPVTDPVWDEMLEWVYEENELTFLRMLIKSDESFARNPLFAVAAVRLEYVVPGWSFVRMLDLKGRVSNCTVLVKFEIQDV